MKRDEFFILQRSSDTERSVIGEVLREPELLDKANLLPEDFTKYKTIYQAILRAREEKGAIDLIILQTYLDDQSFDKANAAASEAFTTANFPVHAETLREWRERRRLHSIFLSAVEGLYKNSIKDVLVPIKQFQEGRKEIGLSNSMKKAIMTVEEIAGKEFPDRPKILDPWLPEASITMIAGPAGSVSHVSPWVF